MYKIKKLQFKNGRANSPIGEFQLHSSSSLVAFRVVIDEQYRIYESKGFPWTSEAQQAAQEYLEKKILEGLEETDTKLAIDEIKKGE